jgi:hypothetical protein
MSEHFERWKELAALCLREQDPEKLGELAREMNLALKGKAPIFDRQPEAVALRFLKPLDCPPSGHLVFRVWKTPQELQR